MLQKMRGCKDLRHACTQGQPAGGARCLERSSCCSDPCWSAHGSIAGQNLLLRLLLTMLWFLWLQHLPPLLLLRLRLCLLLRLRMRMRVHCPLGASTVQNGLHRSIDILACFPIRDDCFCETPLVVSQPVDTAGTHSNKYDDD